MSTGSFLPIFIILMKINFPHIFRSLTVSVLMAGFLAHLMMPFSSHAQKTAFTQWLDHNVVASGNESEIKLRNSIRELPEKSGDFWILVQQASQLVADHKDDFRINFSISDADEHQQVTTWLIGQWNVFQNHQTGSNAILPEIHQPFNKWISPNAFASSTISIPAKDLANRFLLRNEFPFEFIPSRSIIPLASGISINAPPFGLV